jgi:hypothetical protein
MKARKEFRIEAILALRFDSGYVSDDEQIDVLDFMFGKPHMAAELTDMRDFALPYLEEQFPWLPQIIYYGNWDSSVLTPGWLDRLKNESWINDLKEQHGATLMVEETDVVETVTYHGVQGGEDG